MTITIEPERAVGGKQDQGSLRQGDAAESRNSPEKRHQSEKEPRLSVRFRLVCLVLACVLPVWLAAGFLVYHSYTIKRELIENHMRDTARALALEVDRELAGDEGALGALATSPSLTSGDLEAFHRQALEVVDAHEGISIELSDPGAMQVVNTLLPFGSPPRRRSIPDLVREVFQTGKPAVSGLWVGQITGLKLIGVEVPVIRNGRVIYSLGMNIPADRLAAVLAQQQLPPEWVGTIVDSNRVIAARTKSPEKFVGVHVTPAQQLAARSNQGMVEVTGIDGIQVFDYFSRTAMGDWVVVVGIPKAILLAEIRRQLWWTITGTALLSAFGVWLALLIARSVSRIERALRQSREWLGLFIEHAPAALAMFDRRMRYLYASQRWVSDYNLGRRDLRGLSHYDIFPEIGKDWKEAHRRGLAGEIVRSDGDRFERVDGSVQWIRWELRPWYGEDGAVGGIVIFTEDITEPKRAQDALRNSLEEKTALLQEVHHRVKNNLQIVSSLLNLQAKGVRNQAALETLRDTQGRIRSMALLHETLYREGNAAKVNCVVYFSHLCTHLCRSFGHMAEQVQVETKIASVELSLDLAIPCGLIVNELVSNAFKHAFPEGRRGKISVELSAETPGRVLLAVADDGIGLSPDIDYTHADTLGMQLIRGLADQISASLEVKLDPGTRFCLAFPTGMREQHHDGNEDPGG